MKVYSKKNKFVQFSKLSAGDVFVYDGRVYMKTEETIDFFTKENKNCFCLSSNRFGAFSKGTNVHQKSDATLILEKSGNKEQINESKIRDVVLHVIGTQTNEMQNIVDDVRHILEG